MSPESRFLLAQEIARYFYRHLLEELKKPSRLMDKVHFGDATPRQVDMKILDRLLGEFPELPRLPPAPFNLIEKWATATCSGVSTT